MFWPLMQTKSGKAFLEEARNLGREVYVWTVNEEEPMKYVPARTPMSKYPQILTIPDGLLRTSS
jgi:glycerophosphoryl diester phosphodiesterase